MLYSAFAASPAVRRQSSVRSSRVDTILLLTSMAVVGLLSKDGDDDNNDDNDDAMIHHV